MNYSKSVAVVLVTAFVVVGCGGGGDGGTPCTAKNAPNIGGQWTLSSVYVDSGHSTCSSNLTNAVEASLIVGASEVVQVTQNGGSVQIIEPGDGGAHFNGCVDDTGAVSADWNVSDSQQGCNVSIKAHLTGDLSHTQTTVGVAFNVISSGNCTEITTCTVRVNGAFTLTGTAGTLATLETQKGEVLLNSVTRGIAQSVGQ